MVVAPTRLSGEAPDTSPSTGRKPGWKLEDCHGTIGGPSPVAEGSESRQAAATGELVARAVAVVRRPVTFMRPTVTRARSGTHLIYGPGVSGGP
ncbi:hypothetical protein GCM10010431_12010 [Streptomyces kunmingensis]